jgi:iron-sulfur cluster repair protein YtfE (RIC family)
MTIFEVLAQRHGELERLFHDVDEAVAASKHRLARAVFRELSVKLIACLRAEHAVVYPRFAYLAQLETEVAEASREHDAIERAINHIRLAMLTPDEWHEAVKRLQAQVAAHATTEEWVVFPMARLVIGDEDLRAIGAQFVAYEPIAASVAGASITYDVAA